MKKSALMMLSVVALASFGMAGCGSSTSSGSKEILFWHCLGHDKTNNLQAIVDKFNTEHSTDNGGDGYYVTLDGIAKSYDALHDAVKTKLNAGYVPSITMGYPDSFAEYIGSNGADKAKILSLDSFISDDSTFKASDFVTEYYDEGTNYQYTGTWSLPLYKSTEVMYYNKTAFEASAFYKAHGTESYGSYGAVLGQPSTWDWDTLVYVATQIQEENNNKAAGEKTADFHALGYDSDSNLFISQMAQRGIDYTTADATGSSHFLFVGSDGNPLPALQSFATKVYNLTTNDDGILVTQGSYGSYASDLFKKNKVMFTVGSTGGSAYNEPNGTFQCGIVAVPCYHGIKKYIMQGPSLCFFNTKDTAKEKATWEFYSKYISDASMNAALALENSYDPVKTASYSTDNYKEWTALGLDASGNENIDAALQYRIPNLTKTLKDNYMTSPVFIGSSTARTEIGSIISYTKENNGDISKAIKTAYQNCVLASTDKA